MSQIDELRQIIIGDSSEQLDELQRRLNDVDKRTKDVAEVLAPAIDVKFDQDGARLVTSLQKPVSIGIKRAIMAEPKEYAEILYPVMAPSIRRAIAQAISSMMVTINRTIESATSVRGIQMRIQSLRTGVPYGQLVLQRSLLYRVEHIYLIDRETGMLIDEVTSQDSQSLDSDAVSAMFSAIQSFVQDSFSQSESARLTDLKVGDHNVWVAHGPTIMLACVILGDAPESLKRQLYDVADGIRTRYANELADFDGDTRTFAGVDQLMSPLLQMQLKEEYGRDERGWFKTMLPLLLLLGVLGYLVFSWFDRNKQLDTVGHFLRQAPGIATTDIYWQDDNIVVEGLQDPDAQIPYATLMAYGIQQDKLRFKTIPFRSLETEMELQRFRQELDLPRGIYLRASGGEVRLYGEAPIIWLTSNDVRIRQLSADRRLNISELSASFESVSDLLRANFAVADLRGINMSSVVQDKLTVLEISGELEASRLALLKALFAGSYWVKVTARQTRSPAPQTDK